MTENRTLCVFDPLGAYGDTYGLIKEYAQKMKIKGVDFTLRAYTDESVAANDFIGPVGIFTKHWFIMFTLSFISSIRHKYLS